MQATSGLWRGYVKSADGKVMLRTQKGFQSPAELEREFYEAMDRAIVDLVLHPAYGPGEN